MWPRRNTLRVCTTGRRRSGWVRMSVVWCTPGRAWASASGIASRSRQGARGDGLRGATDAGEAYEPDVVPLLRPLPDDVVV
jgi:hypothetical protein